MLPPVKLASTFLRFSDEKEMGFEVQSVTAKILVILV